MVLERERQRGGVVIEREKETEGWGDREGERDRGVG